MATVQKHFMQAAMGKVVMGFLFACFALLMAWGISKFVFKEMLDTVAMLSAPNDRFRIVNSLSHQIARLDQLQRDQAFNNAATETNFIKETRRLGKSLDTLSRLYVGDSIQLNRIKLVKKLLADRNKQFLAYLEVREILVNTKSFSDEVQKLNELVSQRSRQADSAILTTETATATTTIVPDDKKKSGGFLNRLFGKKEAEVYKIINEEFKIKRDTLNSLVEDSIMSGIETSLQSIELEQREKSGRFLKREADLANSSNTLTKQMLSILREVETEALAQIDLKSTSAREVVNDGVAQIMTIIIIFFVIMLILGYLILMDISKSNSYRKALELAKEEAEYHGKAKQRFLSNMSHEIRTPLQSILGYAELILQQENPRKKDINAIYQSSEHLLQIVNEVLDYNQIISGEFRFNEEYFNMLDALTDVAAVMRPLAEQKSLQFLTTFHLEHSLYVKGDVFRLKQLLFNLLGNAIKFTLHGSVKLAVSFKQQADDLHFNFLIEDTGIGFNQADADLIFNEFEQIDALDRRSINRSGTGLGLAIVKALVESQKGRIYVNSKEGLGTKFSLFMKYGRQDKQQDEAIPIGEPVIVNPGKVWIIDDDQLILDLCSLIFDRYHIAHQCFNDVDAVLKEEIDEGIAYVLIDMRLPGMSGLELYRLLKKKFLPNVKFYAISAQVLPDEKDAAIKEGFNGVISKPFKAADLLSIFERNIIITEQIGFDVTLLEKMTLGDKQLLGNILSRFREDCMADINELECSIANGEITTCRLIIHRLAGRIAQIGSKKLGADFRMMEQEIDVNRELKPEQLQRINLLLAKLQDLILLTKGEAYSMP